VRAPHLVAVRDWVDDIVDPLETRTHRARRDKVTGVTVGRSESARARRRRSAGDQHDEDIEADTAEANGFLETRTEGGEHAEHAAKVESRGVDEQDVRREALNRLLEKRGGSARSENEKTLDSPADQP